MGIQPILSSLRIDGTFDGALNREMFKEIAEERGAKIEYLLPYSPDFNLVENMWSKLKSHLRKVKKKQRSSL